MGPVPGNREGMDPCKRENKHLCAVKLDRYMKIAAEVLPFNKESVP